MNVDALREQALANFDSLLHYWDLPYKIIYANEYDIIAKWRNDKNFGGCRFNTDKAYGADFAGGSISKEELHAAGLYIDPSELEGYYNGEQAKIGFDIIGLAQRVHQVNSYQIAALKLQDDLNEIAKNTTLKQAIKNAAELRKKYLKDDQAKKKERAIDLWESAKYHKFEGSPAEKYLINRGINLKEPNLRYHPGIGIEGKLYPTLLCRVQHKPESLELEAIHRIYLTEGGHKAKLKDPKQALAKITGNGIWFGTPGNILCIAEGPENALSLRVMGKRFVVSTVYVANFHNIKIPEYVENVQLFPDNDQPGLKYLALAEKTYKLQAAKNKIITIHIYGNAMYDLNDMLLSRGNDGQ